MKKDDLALVIFVLALLFLVWNLKTDTFILYKGQEIEGEVSEIKGMCWTLGQDRCVKQSVFLINFTEQNLLTCPELYYPTELECQKAFKLVEEPKPTVSCYYIEDDECKVEVIEGLEACPTAYYSNMEECEEALKTPLTHIRKLFKNPTAIIMVIVAIIAGLILIVPKLR